MRPLLRLLRFLAVACAVVGVLALGYAVYFGGLSRPVQPISRPTPTQPLPPPRAPKGADTGSKPVQGDDHPHPLVEGYEQWVIDTIKQYPEVVDAKVQQDEDAIHLVLVMLPGNSAEEARRMGDNLVRLAKQNAEPENGPAKLIGTGQYNYVVQVYVGKRKLYDGAKEAGEDRIRGIINRDE